MPILNKSLLLKSLLNSQSRLKRKRRKVDLLLSLQRINNAISKHITRYLKR